MRARPEEYVVETKIGRAVHALVWSCDHAMDLDLPNGWCVAREGDKLIFRDQANPDQELVHIEDVADGQTRTLRLPSSLVGRRSRPLTVSLKKLKAPRPVYVQNPRVAALQTRAPRQLCAFYGQRYFLIHYRPVGARYAVVQNSMPLFAFTKSANGYSLVARGSGVQVHVSGRKHALNAGGTLELSELDFFRATVVQGIHWWRFRMVPTPDGQPPLESDESDDDLREATRQQYSGVGFLSLVAVILFATYLVARLTPPPPKVIKTEVTLQQPKVFPAFEEKKPPPPPPEVAKVEPPPPPKKPRARAAQKRAAQARGQGEAGEEAAARGRQESHRAAQARGRQEGTRGRGPAAAHRQTAQGPGTIPRAIGRA